LKLSNFFWNPAKPGVFLNELLFKSSENPDDLHNPAWLIDQWKKVESNDDHLNRLQMLARKRDYEGLKEAIGTVKWL
jgi:hypothetical protein